MDKKEFSNIRGHLGKTQSQMAQMLGTSLKAIQSFEQGWRKVPVHIERQMLFLLGKKNSPKRSALCWELQDCPDERRGRCPAWEFQCGDLCWFINGTICHGDVQENWQTKMKLCRECEVFRALVSPPD
jgi:DNA-binding XRE family transcriptional regulator